MLDYVNLRQLLKPLGPVVETGSYFMDLMMYPDIDLNLPLTNPEQLLGVAAELSKLDCVRRIVYRRGMPGELKDSFYIKPEIAYGEWGRDWKVDIWSMPAPLLGSQREHMTDLKHRMTRAQREIILRTKYRLLNSEGRTPMYSGIFIYRAVINEGLSEFEGIVGYLSENGIALS